MIQRLFYSKELIEGQTTVEYLIKNNITQKILPETFRIGAGDVCVHSVCGDGKTEGQEECDDMNTNNYDGCSSTCKIEPDARVTTVL